LDIYRARPETWGIILLVRTGSKEHNINLCCLAQSKGLKLSAAEGVLKPFGGHASVLARETEEAVFAALGLSYIRPEDREV
jgi:DNA polymerase/3'-5' exonuclease PolX